MLLAGTAGIGKTFFARYFMWRLLHPDGSEVKTPLETILYRSTQDEWSLFHKGKIYLIREISWILSTPTGLNILNRKDAWMICDGYPPPNFPKCSILVVTSPGQMQAEQRHSTNRFKKGTICTVYLPPWAPEEVLIAAKEAYNLDESDKVELELRYTK